MLANEVQKNLTAEWTKSAEERITVIFRVLAHFQAKGRMIMDASTS